MDAVGFDQLKINTSKLQRDVSDAFLRIGFPHVLEHVIRMDSLAKDHGIHMAAVPNEILSLDIADVGAKIGIEVDGPFHFISNIDKISPSDTGMQMIAGRKGGIFNASGEGFEMNGATCLKHKLMEGLGWKIIHIPFWEWDSLLGDPALEEDYCQNILAMEQLKDEEYK